MIAQISLDLCLRGQGTRRVTTESAHFLNEPIDRSFMSGLPQISAKVVLYQSCQDDELKRRQKSLLQAVQHYSKALSECQVV